jgi:uncharacterized coiled-coil protein SlyX
MRTVFYALLGASFALSSCSEIGLTETQREEVADIASDHASDEDISQDEIVRLEQRIEALGALVEAQGDYIDALSGSLGEARDNHSSLRDTVNANVDKTIQRNRYVDQELCSIGIGNCRR